MDSARLPTKGLDEESAGWLRRLGTDGGERQAGERELHARLPGLLAPETTGELSGTLHLHAADGQTEWWMEVFGRLEFLDSWKQLRR